MKKILVELRQWLGLSQHEMALALNISRSLYALAELNRRTLDPETTMVVLWLYKYMESAPPHPAMPSMEKLVQMELLLDAELEGDFRRKQMVSKQRTKKFKPPFPEKEFRVPTAGAPEENLPDKPDVMNQIAHLSTRRIHQYKKAYLLTLKEELVLVANEAVAEFLRRKLGIPTG